MAMTAKQAYDFCIKMNNGKRNKYLENIIKTDSGFASEYALMVIKGAWPEAEDVIQTVPVWAYQYAKNTLRRPWPEAEDVIKNSPLYACVYAKFILKARWPEAEPYIAKSKSNWEYYREYFGI